VEGGVCSSRAQAGHSSLSGRQGQVAFGAQGRVLGQRLVGLALGLLLGKQAHQAQRLHIGPQGKPPAGQAPAGLVQLQRAHAGMVEMAQRQARQRRCRPRPRGPGGPFAGGVAGQQAAVGQGQQALGKTKLAVQVNHQGAQNVLFGCKL
jgi:hypothetical protein